MSYSDDRAATLRRAGIYTGRVLRGETAKALGLDLQWRTVLAYADEVIE